MLAATAWVPVQPVPGVQVVGVIEHPGGARVPITIHHGTPAYAREWIWRVLTVVGERESPDTPLPPAIGAWRPATPRAIRWGWLAIELGTLLCLGGLSVVVLHTWQRRRATNLAAATGNRMGPNRWPRRISVGLGLLGIVAGVTNSWPPDVVVRRALPCELPQDRSGWGAPDLHVEVRVGAGGVSAWYHDGFVGEGTPSNFGPVLPLDDLEREIASRAASGDYRVIDGSIEAEAGTPFEQFVAAWAMLSRVPIRERVLEPPPVGPLAPARPSAAPLALTPVGRSHRYRVRADLAADIYVDRDGGIRARWPGAAEPGARLTLLQLHQQLMLHGRPRCQPSGLSELTLFLHVDRRSPWASAFVPLTECAKVGIYRIAIVVADPASG